MYPFGNLEKWQGMGNPLGYVIIFCELSGLGFVFSLAVLCGMWDLSSLMKDQTPGLPGDSLYLLIENTHFYSSPLNLVLCCPGVRWSQT